MRVSRHPLALASAACCSRPFQQHNLLRDVRQQGDARSAIPSAIGDGVGGSIQYDGGVAINPIKPPHTMPDSLFFEYDLPRDRIAQQPLANRADARLMVVHRRTGNIDHLHVRDMPELLRAGDALVMNETKVVAAQLMGNRKSTGGRWQGLFLRSRDDGAWVIVCKTRGKLSPGEIIVLVDREGRPSRKLCLIERLDGGQWVASIDGDQPVDELLDIVGRVPLPHYIRGGKMVDTDFDNYQTVFAKHPGAVAAPTAGLHFTRKLLVDLSERGVQFAPVTLHVGLGTFRPISVDEPSQHDMHSEWGELPAESAEKINAVRQDKKRVIAVGTTSVRVLETGRRARRFS